LELRLSRSYGPGRYDPSYERDGVDYPVGYVRWTEQRNMEAFLTLVADGKVTPKRLVTHRFPIAEAEKAYELMESGAPHLAILLTYPEPPTDSERLIRRAPPPPRSEANRVAFIGFGNYAKGVLLPALRKAPGVTLIAVATSTGLSAGHAGAKHGFATVATDPAAVIADPDADTVFIASRHDTHARFAAEALRTGKHVFCEKPLALSWEGLAEVMAAARQAPGTLAVGFNRRFAPLLQKARAALEPRSGPLVMLYRINAGAIPGDSWIQREEGGGRIVGEVCHFVDVLTFLARSLPVEVYALAARDHADAVSALVRFTDGSTGTIVYSSLGDVGVPKEYLEAFADRRVIQLDDFCRLTVTRSGKSVTSKSAQDKGQRGLVAAFLEATRGKRDAPIPLSELVAVTEATFAIEESLRRGSPVRIEAPAY
jgi:polar amino acid transport system substrate-binding protein